MSNVRIAPFLAILLALAGIAGFRITALGQPAGCSVNPSDMSIDAEEQAALDAINALRAGGGLPALGLSPTLGQAAASKSATMAATGIFSHDDSGRSWAQRIRDCGYRASPAMTENIAVGTDTGRFTVQMWRESAPHLRNMLDGRMRAVGIARVRGATGWYWTADFGGAMDNGSEAGVTATAPAVIGAPAAPTPSPSRTPQIPAAIPTSAPAASPSPSPAPPVRSTSQTALAGAAIALGAAVTVDTPDDCLNVRIGPSLSATILTCLPDRTPVEIVGGPVVADAHTWWQLEGLGWSSGEFLSSGASR